MIRSLGAVTVGQSPREDLLEPLRARLPADVEVFEVGALDHLDPADLPQPRRRDYPITTRLRDGTLLTLGESILSPLVQSAIDEAEEFGAETTLLLCAGAFVGVRAARRLVRPYDAAIAELRARHVRSVAVLVPFEAQSGPAERKWRSARFEPTMLVGHPVTVAEPIGVGALILDYVGHLAADIVALRARLTIPVIDLGEGGAAVAAASFR